MSYGNGMGNGWQRQLFQSALSQSMMNGGGHRSSMNTGGGGGGQNSYDTPRQNNSIGTVTKLKNDWGLINDDVFFYLSACRGTYPRLGDRVLFDSMYCSGEQFKWNATRLQVMQEGRGYNSSYGASNYGGRSGPMRRMSPPRRGSRMERDRMGRDRKMIESSRRPERRNPPPPRGKPATANGKSIAPRNGKPTPRIRVRTRRGIADKKSDPKRSATVKVKTKSGAFVAIKAKHFKRVDPAKAGHRERRIACHILRRELEIPITEDDLSKEDFKTLQEDIVWAKAVMPDFDPTRKRYVSSDKKAKEASPPQLKFSEVAKNRTIIAVLDRSDESGKIPRHQWKWVTAALSTVALQVLEENPGAPPSCNDVGWLEGNIKLVACDDERSVLLYKAAIEMVGEAYEGAKLEVCDPSEISPQPTASGSFPATPSDPEKILQLIKDCNPTIPADGLTVFEVESSERPKRQVILQISKECLESLAKCDNTISYGFSKIKLEVKKPEKDLEDMLVEPPSDDDAADEEEEGDENAQEEGEEEHAEDEEEAEVIEDDEEEVEEEEAA